MAIETLGVVQLLVTVDFGIGPIGAVEFQRPVGDLAWTDPGRRRGGEERNRAD